MRYLEDLRPYQHEAIQHLVRWPYSALWLDMGLGKTVSTLTAVDFMLRMEEIRGVLVVAPLRVAQTVWKQEVEEWSHLHHLRVSRILGDESQRRAALRVEADIYITNYESLNWLTRYLLVDLAKKGAPLPFDMVVWDEVTKLKNSTSQRSKAAKTLLHHMKRRVGLTGTPSANGLIDLHGQFLVLDGGRRLGIYKSHFLEAYFTKGFYDYKLKPAAAEMIRAKVQDITLDMSAEGRVPLPPFTVNDIVLEMPPDIAAKYKTLEREFLIKFESGDQAEVFNAAALTGKCLQFANGAAYTDAEGAWQPVHDMKLGALAEIVEAANGNPVLVAYSFKSDAERILAQHPNAVNLTAATGKKAEKIVEAWNRGEIPLMIGHPASMGHGLNLQGGGHTIVWFGLNWSLDLYEQFNARLQRSGQTKPVVCHRLLVKDTLDQVVAMALEMKALGQNSLRYAVRKYQVRT